MFPVVPYDSMQCAYYFSLYFLHAIPGSTSHVPFYIADRFLVSNGIDHDFLSRNSFYIYIQLRTYVSDADNTLKREELYDIRNIFLSA